MSRDPRPPTASLPPSQNADEPHVSGKMDYSCASVSILACSHARICAASPTREALIPLSQAAHPAFGARLHTSSFVSSPWSSPHHLSPLPARALSAQPGPAQKCSAMNKHSGREECKLQCKKPQLIARKLPGRSPSASRVEEAEVGGGREARYTKQGSGPGQELSGARQDDSRARQCSSGEGTPMQLEGWATIEAGLHRPLSRALNNLTEPVTGMWKSQEYGCERGARSHTGWLIRPSRHPGRGQGRWGSGAKQWQPRQR